MGKNIHSFAVGLPFFSSYVGTVCPFFLALWWNNAKRKLVFGWFWGLFESIYKLVDTRFFKVDSLAHSYSDTH